MRALVHTLIGFDAGIQRNVPEALGGVFLYWFRAASELSKDVAPPAVETRPAAVMAVQVVSRADVRVGSGQVSIDQRLRKAGRTIVDINVGQFVVARNGELNRGRSLLQPVTDGKALVINAVVAIVKELLAAAENVNRIGLQVHIQAELPVAAHAGFLSHHFVNGFHQVDRSTQALALRIRDLGVQQRMGYGVECGADGQSSVVVGLFGHKLASGGGVITPNEVVYQPLLLGTQRGVGFAELQAFAFWLLGLADFF